MAFDATTGNLINPDFIPADPDNLSTPICAILSADGNSVLVSDQLDDVVQEYALDGTYLGVFALGVFAPAGSENNDILDNIRGIAPRSNGNLLVTVGSNDNADAVAEFDTDGNFLGNFVDVGVGGLDSPFDVLMRADDSLVGGISSDEIHQYDLMGNYLGAFSPIDTFPEQIHETASGNILVANFSGDEEGIVEYLPNGTFVGVYDVPELGGYRGAYELPNGNILTTNGGGVHEIDRMGNLVETKIDGVSARFIELVVIGGGGGVEAPLDIKPGSCPNPLNRTSRGVLPVAILGTADFDVTEIDVTTLSIARADGVGGSVAPNFGPPGPGVAYEDVSSPFEGEACDCHEGELDGFVDLGLKFWNADLVAGLELKTWLRARTSSSSSAANCSMAATSRLRTASSSFRWVADPADPVSARIEVRTGTESNEHPSRARSCIRATGPALRSVREDVRGGESSHERPLARRRSGGPWRERSCSDSLSSGFSARRARRSGRASHARARVARSLLHSSPPGLRAGATSTAGLESVADSRARMNAAITTSRTAKPRCNAPGRTRALTTLPAKLPTMPTRQSSPMIPQSTWAPAAARTRRYSRKPVPDFIAMMTEGEELDVPGHERRDPRSREGPGHARDSEEEDVAPVDELGSRVGDGAQQRDRPDDSERLRDRDLRASQGAHVRRFHGIFDRRTPIPHQPDRPAKTSPHPTKPDIARNQGDKVVPRATLSTTSEPATTCTWRMTGRRGPPSGRTTSPSAAFHCSMPPAAWKTGSSPRR